MDRLPYPVRGDSPMVVCVVSGERLLSYNAVKRPRNSRCSVAGEYIPALKHLKKAYRGAKAVEVIHIEFEDKLLPFRLLLMPRRL